MSVLRGKGLGLEIVLTGDDFDASLSELESRLGERREFYRGTAATAAFGEVVPSAFQMARLRGVLDTAGIVLRGLSGCAEVAGVAAEQGLGYEVAAAPGGELERRRALRPRRELELSDSARTLVADFAGARADIAERRKKGSSSVRRFEPRAPEALPLVALAPTTPATLYHVGTLRGGQSLHHPGNIVIVGDVNPGAELVATGDVLVFGSLRGVAHAGAQGDASARVFALDLAATQLRIATCIAADDARKRIPGPPRPEGAVVRDGRIVIVAYDQLDRLPEEGASLR